MGEKGAPSVELYDVTFVFVSYENAFPAFSLDKVNRRRKVCVSVGFFVVERVIA